MGVSSREDEKGGNYGVEGREGGKNFFKAGKNRKGHLKGQ